MIDKCNIYDVLSKLFSNMQRVNIFIWERIQFVRNSINDFKDMYDNPPDQNSKKYWKACSEYWPSLENYTFINNLPNLGQESTSQYLPRRNKVEFCVESESSLFKTAEKLKALFLKMSDRIDKRLLSNKAEL